jgi:hypothetical protein
VVGPCIRWQKEPYILSSQVKFDGESHFEIPALSMLFFTPIRYLLSHASLMCMCLTPNSILQYAEVNRDFVVLVSAVSPFCPNPNDPCIDYKITLSVSVISL